MYFSPAQRLKVSSHSFSVHYFIDLCFVFCFLQYLKLKLSRLISFIAVNIYFIYCIHLVSCAKCHLLMHLHTEKQNPINNHHRTFSWYSDGLPDNTREGVSLVIFLTDC